MTASNRNPDVRLCRVAMFSSEIRKLGGFVSISERHDRFDGDAFFTVTHVSRGGDVVFQSGRLADADQASAAARVLAQFTGTEVRR